ncbi:MAG: hypothetical protein WC326_07560 [Candidatus Delongbacteria bacterium]
MDKRISSQRLAEAPLAPAHWLELREGLDARPNGESLARLAETHAPLLLALLRRAGSAAAHPADCPRSAREAVERLGLPESHRLLHALLLLIQPCPDAPGSRAQACRRAARRLLEQVPAAEYRPGELERTLLHLLEWAGQCAAAAGAEPPAGQLGPWLLDSLGGAAGLHPELTAALLATSAPADSDPTAARRGDLLRAAWKLGAAETTELPIDEALARRLGLPARPAGGRHA